MNEIIASIFLLIGGAFLLIGSVGLSKLPDFYMRLHAPTKASTLGIGAILIGSIVFFSGQVSGITVKEILITLFLFLTAPITAHMLSKTALHTKIPPTEGTINADLFDKMRERESK
ncbi:Na+/H+ antiporter subunit G [Reinekea forsetii]|nr:Na+/H+ antiporter subunit G [Reinekea forsetii]